MNTFLTWFRSLAFILFLSASVVLYAIPLTLVGWFLPPKLLHRIGTTWSLANLWMLRRVCGLGYRVRGLENLPKKNCIVLSNHQSAWETIAFRTILPLRQKWVLKKELLWLPFFGWGLAPYRPIAIDRRQGRKAAQKLLDEGREALREGYWIIMFPEGTRVSPGADQRYSIGGALLAERTGFSIVPVAHNAGLFWPRRALAKHPGMIDVAIGPPIEPKSRPAIQINDQVRSWIRGAMADLHPHTLAPEQKDLVVS